MHRSIIIMAIVWLLCFGMAQPLCALVTGTPEPPAPGPPPEWWIENGNDWYGFHIPNKPAGDDFRTEETTLVGCPGKYLALVIDDSILTDRSGGTRTDEVTGTIGSRFDIHVPHADAWGAVLIGARFLGDADGQQIQNFTHRVFGDAHYQLREESDHWDGIGCLFLSVRQVSGHFGWDSLASGLVTSSDQMEADAAVHGDAEFQIENRTLQLWLGCRWCGNAGPQLSSTETAVDNHESGARLDFGLAYSIFALTESWDPVRNRSYGIIAITVNR